MAIPPYVPRVSPWKNLPDGADPDAAGADMRPLAEDVNAWQDRLSLLTTAVNDVDAGLTSLSSGTSVLTSGQPKGTQLVHDGKVWRAATGSKGQVLTPDSSAASGYSWLRPHPSSLWTGDEAIVTLNTTKDIGVKFYAPQTASAGRQLPATTSTPFVAEVSFTARPFTIYRGADDGVRIKASANVLAVSLTHYNGVMAGSWSLGYIVFPGVIPPAFRPAAVTVLSPFGARHLSKGVQSTSYNSFDSDEYRSYGYGAGAPVSETPQDAYRQFSSPGSQGYVTPNGDLGFRVYNTGNDASTANPFTVALTEGVALWRAA